MDCSDEEWEARERLIALLEKEGYWVNKDSPNPLRLFASKQHFLIDIWKPNLIGIIPMIGSRFDGDNTAYLDIKHLVETQFKVLT